MPVVDGAEEQGVQRRAPLTLIDLSFLSEEERGKILHVLKRDEELRKSEEVRVKKTNRKLKTELHELRKKAAVSTDDETSNKNGCARCHEDLGLFSSGNQCPKCKHNVCAQCQVFTPTGKRWLCVVCHKAMQIKIESGEWFYEKLEVAEKVTLFGSDLVKASLAKAKGDPSHPPKLTLDDLRPSSAESTPRAKHRVRHRRTNSNPKDLRNYNRHHAHHADSASDRDSGWSQHNGASLDASESSQPSSSLHEDDAHQQSSRYDHGYGSSPSRRYPRYSEGWEVHPDDVISLTSSSSDLTTTETESSYSRNSHEGATSWSSRTESQGHRTPPRVQRHSFQTVASIHSSTGSERVDVNDSDSEAEDTTEATTGFRFTRVSVKKTPGTPTRDVYGTSLEPTIEEQDHLVPTDRASGHRSPSHSRTGSPAGSRSGSTRSRSSSKARPRSGSTRSPARSRSGSTRSQKKASSTTGSSSDAGVGGGGPSSKEVAAAITNYEAKRVNDASSRETAVDGRPPAGESEQGPGPEILVHEVHSEPATTEDDGLAREDEDIDRYIQATTPTHTIGATGGLSLTPSSIHGEQNGKATNGALPHSSSTVPHQGEGDETSSHADSVSIVSTSSPTRNFTKYSTSESSFSSSQGNTLARRLQRQGPPLHKGSSTSLTSLYSEAGEYYGKFPITGDIQFGLNYNYKIGLFEIKIINCRDLAPTDAKKNKSDPYVKTYLLPDKTKNGKRKTKVKRGTINPMYEETLKYTISQSELQSRTLSVSVWNRDAFGRNTFLGEVMLPLDTISPDKYPPQWHPLCNKAPPAESTLSYKGDIVVALRFEPSEELNGSQEPMVEVTTDKQKKKKGKRKESPKRSDGTLFVHIKEAKNLMAVRMNGSSNPFVKCYLEPDRSKAGKRKTNVVKNNLNPSWQYKLKYDDVAVKNLRHRCLELTVWDYDTIGSNDFLGGVRLGMGSGLSFGKDVDWMDSSPAEISLWESMLRNPGEWSEATLTLRPHMNTKRAT